VGEARRSIIGMAGTSPAMTSGKCRQSCPCCRGRGEAIDIYADLKNAKAPDEPGPSIIVSNLISACDDAVRDAEREHRPTAVPDLSIRPTH